MARYLRASSENKRSDHGQQDLESEEEKIRRLEGENALLRGKIRGFDTLSDLFRESKKKNRIYAQQNALLVQILSLLIPSTSADESADLPDELETILELDTRPDEESLRLLTSITSKLKNKISEKSETTGEESKKEAETSQKIRNENALKRTESETEELPPRYHLVSESETTGTASSASFSIIQQRSQEILPASVLIDQHREAIAEFKTIIITPHLLASEKVKTICELFELVLKGNGLQADLDDLHRCFGEVLHAVEQLESHIQDLTTEKEKACAELERLKEESVAMGTVQGQLNDSSWVDVSHDANAVLNPLPPSSSFSDLEKIRKECEHKDHLLKKLRGHIDELTKANVAWSKKYEMMKKEFSSKIIKLKSMQKSQPRQPEIADFVLVGPGEPTLAENKPKILDSEARERKETDMELTLLRQQVRLFKDDFATERNEHKKLWKKHQKITENYEDMKRRVQEVSNKLAKTQRQLATEKHEKELAQKKALRSQCQDVSRLNHGPVLPDHVTQNDVWRCPACTFDNALERIVCEMCGKRALSPATVAPTPSGAKMMFCDG